MTISEKNQFAKLSLETLYDLELLGIPFDQAINGVAAEIDELLELNSPQIKSQRCEYFNISNTTPEDYAERIFNIGSGKLFLAGIRHLSGSKDKPFVNIFLSFVPTKDDLRKLIGFAKEEFHKFSPTSITFSLKPSAVAAIQNDHPVTPSRNHVVGRLSAIRLENPPFGIESVSLKAIGSEFDFSWYDKVYAEFHDLNPELKDWVPATDREDLLECSKDGLLFEVFISDQKAGVIAGKRDVFLGRPSVYMTELLLTSEFKGKRMASALQRKFINQLPSEIEFIWGTIDSKNEPSLKTALKVGRSIVRTELFLAI